MNYLIFDAEIIKAIHNPKEGPRLDGIEYCDGWNDHANMGISTVSLAWLGKPGDPLNLLEASVYDWTDEGQREEALEHMFYAKNLGGFNSRKFDDKLFRANGINVTSHFDIFEMVLSAAGWLGKAYWNDGRKYNLDFITAANGMEKTGHGALAPIWWQRGEKRRVLDYCRNDAHIEREVLRLLLAGELVDPNDGRLLKFEGVL